MKIAIPVANNLLCMHFGHCEKFAFFTVDQEKKAILEREDITPPPHEPGILPGWIKKQGADVVLAGGMGQRAQGLFTQSGVNVIVGVVENHPEKAILDFLNQSLATGSNACDH